MTTLHRRSTLRALALLWSAAVATVGALACTPLPAAPVIPSADASWGQRPTFTVSFVYEPELTLRLLRDGQPYEGEATLDLPDHTEQKDEQAPLVFHQGQAPIQHDFLERFEYKQGLSLHVGGHDLPMPQSAGTDPFACARSIETVRSLAACRSVPLRADTQIEHCDTNGQRAWQKASEHLIEQAMACWSAPDEPTLRRLATIDDLGLASFACQQMIEAVGHDPPTEQGVKLLPLCLPFFAPAVKQRLDDAYARLHLPDALAAAQRGNSPQMRAFYHRYRAIAPEEAEKIRALAEQRFGPPDRARWLALRKAIEAQTSDPWRATLCDLQDNLAEVALQEGHLPRYTRRPSPEARSQPGFAPDIVPDPRKTMARSQLTARLNALIKTRARVSQVVYVNSCDRGKHWYLAETP